MSKENILEDVPANNVSGGHVAGISADTINDILVIDKKKQKVHKRIEKSDDTIMAPHNNNKLTKESFSQGMSDIISSHFYINEAKEHTIPPEVKKKLIAALQAGKAQVELDKTDSEKETDEKDEKNPKHSNLYIWNTSTGTEEKVKKVIKDYNDTHPHHKLHVRMYPGSTLTRLFISGDPLSRKQVSNSLESAGAKKYK